MAKHTRRLLPLVTAFRHRLREARHDDRGNVIEVVIIAGGLAALALSVVAAITVLVDAKVGGISL